MEAKLQHGGFVAYYLLLDNKFCTSSGYLGFIDFKAGRSFNSFLVCSDSSASINYFLPRINSKTSRSFMDYIEAPFLRLKTIFKSGIFEASKTVLINFAPILLDLQVKVIL
nr:hypothetical protein [Tanacetum cinerariifolium]